MVHKTVKYKIIIQMYVLFYFSKLIRHILCNNKHIYLNSKVFKKLNMNSSKKKNIIVKKIKSKHIRPTLIIIILLNNYYK